MSRVVAVVEGQTEQDFVRNVLAPWLGARGVFLTARLVGKPGQKGGVGEYPRARMDILVVLKSDPTVIVTTMFDFYGMPTSWPGRSLAKQETHSCKAQLLENLLHDDISKVMGDSFNGSRFIPYIQLHEFEALLFSDPATVCEVLRSPEKADHIQKMRDGFVTPEEINDSPTTAPSKRLERLFADYRKRLHGVIAASRIGIQHMREECPHFNAWVEALERLAVKVEC